MSRTQPGRWFVFAAGKFPGPNKPANDQPIAWKGVRWNSGNISKLYVYVPLFSYLPCVSSIAHMCIMFLQLLTFAFYIVPTFPLLPFSFRNPPFLLIPFCSYIFLGFLCILWPLPPLRGEHMVLCYTRWQPTKGLTEFAVCWGGAGFESGTTDLQSGVLPLNYHWTTSLIPQAKWHGLITWRNITVKFNGAICYVGDD